MRHLIGLVLVALLVSPLPAWAQPKKSGPSKWTVLLYHKPNDKEVLRGEAVIELPDKITVFTDMDTKRILTMDSIRILELTEGKKNVQASWVLRSGEQSKTDNQVVEEWKVPTYVPAKLKAEDLRIKLGAGVTKIVFLAPVTADEKECDDAPCCKGAANAVPKFPFWHEPIVWPISNDAGECCKLPKFCSLEECAKKEKLGIWWYRFRCAANFPQPRFSDDGERFNTPGTVIYEGMQLVVASDGRYEVAFNATTPKVPVTLRFRLTIVAAGGEPVILTIPPISIVPPGRPADDIGGAPTAVTNSFRLNWHVRHVGYSPELAATVAQPDRIIAVERAGVARVGNLPQPR